MRTLSKTLNLHENTFQELNFKLLVTTITHNPLNFSPQISPHFFHVIIPQTNYTLSDSDRPFVWTKASDICRPIFVSYCPISGRHRVHPKQQ